MINKFKQRKSQKNRKYTYVPNQSLRNEEVAVYRKLALTAVLVIGFAISLYLWGIPLIVQLGNFWENIGTSPTPIQEPNTNETTLISPRLNPLPAVVKSLDEIVISGTAPSGFDVAIYINDEKHVTVLADATGSFEVKDLKLVEGENTIYARTVRKEEESEASNKQLVVFDTTKPKLELIQPENGTTTQESSLEVIGTTEPQAKVTINGIQAIVNATTGDFNRDIQLNEGSNELEIISTDRAGNTSTIKITVTREVENTEDESTES